jgi:hypothetical protein
MKTYGSLKVKIHTFSALALEGELFDLLSGRYILGKRTSDNHWTGDWVCAEPVWVRHFVVSIVHLLLQNTINNV